MSGFCGWIGTGSGDSAGVLDALASGLTLTGGDIAARHIGARGALHAAGPGTAPLHVHPDGLVVALEGSPWFSAARRQRLAEARGAAAAVADAYLADPDGVLEELRGGFALAILDARRDRLLLAVDRMGIHSLCYAATSAGMVFATSLDALRRHPEVDTSVGPQAVYRYALNTVSPAPFTIYEACWKLLPGHYLRHPDGGTTQQRYWSPPYGRADAKPFEEQKARLFDVLETSVRRAASRTPEDSRGAFLSGGLDSSAVCGLLQGIQQRPLPAFTIGFEDEAYDEKAFARVAATHFGLDYHEYCLQSGDVADLLPRLAEVFDEPFGNSSVIPAYFCARMAREEGIELMLAGDGGDEIFAGNRRYAQQKILAAYHHLPRPLRAAVEAAAGDRPPPPPDSRSLLARALRYLRRANTPMPERMLYPLIYKRENLGRIFTEEALAAIDVEEPYRLWQRHYDEAGTSDLVYAMQHLDLRTALADNDLRKVGRACAMAGVEVAYPMLDEEVVSFAAGIPAGQLLPGTRLRHFFRKAMRGYLPETVLSKKKHGFGMPFVDWTRNEPRLTEMVDDCFATLKTRGIFRPEFLDEVVAQHRRNRSALHSALVYDLVMLDLWQRSREAPRGEARDETGATWRHAASA